MVRIISQNFSQPRSRHSSGETDKDLAERTKAALSSLGGVGSSKRFDSVNLQNAEYESSSDSFWDSEIDGEHNDQSLLGDRTDINGNEGEKSDLKSVRKDRRRERNKLSAQLYRKRRRHQSAQEAQVLTDLAEENKRLHKLVDSLEKETEDVKKTLRSYPMPSAVPFPDVSHHVHHSLKPVPEEPATEESVAASTSSSSSSSSLSSLHTTIGEQNLYQSNINNNVIHNQFSNNNNNNNHNVMAYQVQNGGNANENTNTLSSTPNSTKENVNANSNMSKFNLFPAQILTTGNLPKNEQNNQILLQGHSLMGAAIGYQNGTNFSAHAIPAYVAVPVEDSKNMLSNSNLNLNMPYVSTQEISNSTNYNNESKSVRANSSLTGVLNSNASFAVGSANFNHNVALCNPEHSVAFEVVKVQLCNSNVNVNSNFSTLKFENSKTCDSVRLNGNQNCLSFPKVNLNLNYKPEIEKVATYVNPQP